MTGAFAGATLAGARVLEIGHFVAAPFCTRILADLGADVIKVEPFGGDPVRQWGEQIDGRSLWWSVHARNKRSVAIDLKNPEARNLILKLAAQCDVVVENFRPGHLCKLGLGPDDLRAARSDLVITHISGFGQTGPYRDRAAFGVIGEAIGGLRYLTNHAPGTSDLAPVRVGVSIGDTLAGLYAAFGTMAALWQRDRRGGDGIGRRIDVALTESVLSVMEGMLPEYGRLGKVKQPTGGAIATAAPTNAYPTKDQQWMLIAANSEPLFKKLCRLIARPDLVDAPDYAGNAARVRNAAVLDGIIGNWSGRHDADALDRLLDAEDIPHSKVYDAIDCASDPQYRSRNMVREVVDPLLGTVLHPGIVPHIDGGADDIRWTGPEIGQHTNEVLRELVGLADPAIAGLRARGVVA